MPITLHFMQIGFIIPLVAYSLAAHLRIRNGGTMNFPFRYTSKTTIEELVKNLSEREGKTSNNEVHHLMFALFSLLCESGIDYYDLLALYSTLPCYTSEDLQTLLRYAPPSLADLSPTKENIRRAIPRWTASRYHSATIETVIREVQGKLLLASPGIFCYNSNLNPKNQRSLNDLYILIITGEKRRWFDINRKCTYRFLQGEM